jgi:hypothetical protein
MKERRDRHNDKEKDPAELQRLYEKFHYRSSPFLL